MLLPWLFHLVSSALDRIISILRTTVFALDIWALKSGCNYQKVFTRGTKQVENSTSFQSLPMWAKFDPTVLGRLCVSLPHHKLNYLVYPSSKHEEQSLLFLTTVADKDKQVSKAGHKLHYWSTSSTIISIF